MKKGMKTTMIALIAILVFAVMAVPVSAASSNTHVTNVTLTKENAKLKVGQNIGLGFSYGYTGAKPDVDDVTWKSSNNSVATVDDGFVKTKHAGTAVITVDFDGTTDTCKVTVTAEAAKVVSAKACYTQLNKYRKAKRIKALKRSAKLEKIAQIRAKELEKKFSHTRPNGKKGLSLIKGNVYKGENIAMGQTSCAQVSKAWYNSKGHRANMMNKHFKKVGIAAFKIDGVTYWVQVFSS